MENISQSPSAVASAPFDKPSADIILRSSDNIDFRVFKAVLLLASTVFESMLDLPQPAIHSVPVVHNNTRIPIVPVSEDSQTLDHLLRICYPIIDPVLEDLQEISSVLEAAIKYDMEDAVYQMKNSLASFVSKDPFHVYVIACRLRLEIEAAAAASKTLGYATFQYIPQMDSISAGALYRLLQYRRQPSSFPPSSFTSPGSTQSLRAIITTHPFNYASADVVVQSSDLVRFRVHAFMLSEASAVFASILALKKGASPAGDAEEVRVLELPEDGLTISNLLRLYYPVADPDIANVDVAQALLIAAVKYKLARATTFAHREFLECTRTRPLQAYFIAMQQLLAEEATKAEAVSEGESGRTCGAAELWRTIATICAERAVYETHHDEYTPEMEIISAKIYHRFLDYRTCCERVISSSMTPFNEKVPSGGFMTTTTYSPRVDVPLDWSDRNYRTNSRCCSSWRKSQSEIVVRDSNQPQIDILTPVMRRALAENKDLDRNPHYRRECVEWDVARVMKESKDLGEKLQTGLVKIKL